MTISNTSVSPSVVEDYIQNSKPATALRLTFPIRNFALIILTIFFSFFSNIRAEEPDNYYRYGGYGNYGIVYNSAEFSALPAIPNCCPEFEHGRGYGIFFGGLIEYNFSGIAIEGRLGVELLNGRFKSEEARIFGINGVPVPGKFEHIVDYTLNSISTGVSVRYNFWNNFNLMLGLGAAYSVGSSYHQFERISSPAGRVTFADTNGNSTGSDIRNELRGDLPYLNKLQFSSIGKIAYEYPLKSDKTLVLRPELSYQYIFNNMLENVDWKTTSIRFGVSLIYSSVAFEPEIPKGPSVEDLIKLQLEEENRKSFELAESRRKLEDELKKSQEERQRIERELSVKDSLLALSQKKEPSEAELVALEREEFNRRIEEENRKAGSICNCYMILFTSTTDKTSAENLLIKLVKFGFKSVKITEYIEPYLQDKYFRVQSECYSDHLQAFDARLNFMQSGIEITSNPQIICNR